MKTPQTPDLLATGCFHVEIDGVSAGGFARVSGLDAAFEVLPYWEGGAAAPRVLRGSSRPGRLVLERGLAKDGTLWKWFQRGDPRDGAVLLLDAGGRERMRWWFRRAWPCAWQGPELDAGRADVAIERVEIAHEGFAWDLS